MYSKQRYPGSTDVTTRISEGTSSQKLEGNGSLTGSATCHPAGLKPLKPLVPASVGSTLHPAAVPGKRFRDNASHFYDAIFSNFLFNALQ